MKKFLEDNPEAYIVVIYGIGAIVYLTFVIISKLT